MKIILMEDVYKHGVAGEVVEVADGFARNYLIPQGMALKATPGTLKQLTHLRAEVSKRRELRNQELQEVAEKIEALTIAFPVKAGETGKLYGSVTSGHIVEAIEAELGIVIDRRRIGEQPLRQLGQHEVVVRLSSTLAPSVKVLVHREGEPPESALEVAPTDEVKEEPTVFDEVMVEEEELLEAEDAAIDEAEGASEEAADEAAPEADTLEDA